MTSFKLQVQLLSHNAKIPDRAHENDAGYDLYSAEYTTIKPGEINNISLDIAVSIPPGHYGRIAPRSGLASKYGANVLAGVIDSNYRGNVKVIMTTYKEFEVSIGFKIAQLIIEKISMPEIEIVNKLNDTSRGTSGFGSTGNQSN